MSGFNVGEAGITLIQVASEISKASGWAVYSDTVYTSGSPFSVVADTDTVLPNNAGSIVDSQLPEDVDTFYNGTTITGRNGDGVTLTVDLVATPSSVAATTLEVWFDIGGAVGELYRRIITFPKGTGVDRPLNFTINGYTLGTWETNGATVYVRSNGPLTLHAIRYIIARSHKAR